MSEREEGDVEQPADAQRNEGKGGYRIPGRDFAGTSFASTEREQTADHRGESERHRMDDAQSLEEDQEGRPRDES